VAKIPSPASGGSRRPHPVFVQSGFKAPIGHGQRASLQTWQGPTRNSKLCNNESPPRVADRRLHGKAAESCFSFPSIPAAWSVHTTISATAIRCFRRSFPWFQGTSTWWLRQPGSLPGSVSPRCADSRFAVSGAHGSWGNRQKHGRQTVLFRKALQKVQRPRIASLTLISRCSDIVWSGYLIGLWLISFWLAGSILSGHAPSPGASLIHA